jgi:putative membrane protein insertion efficiency factor
MGHGNSSETLSGGGAFRAAATGVAAPVAESAGATPRSGALSVTARALLLLLRVYQTFFSALMPSACKFYPTCSHYAVDAVRVHCARRGAWLAMRRVARCHPFTRGGVDLVPGVEVHPGFEVHPGLEVHDDQIATDEVHGDNLSSHNLPGREARP